MQLTDNIKSFYVYLFERNRKIMPFRFFSNSFCQFIYPSILLLSITNMIIIHTKHGGGGGLCSTPVSSPWVFKEVSETTEDFCDLGDGSSWPRPGVIWPTSRYQYHQQPIVYYFILKGCLLGHHWCSSVLSIKSLNDFIKVNTILINIWTVKTPLIFKTDASINSIQFIRCYHRFAP